MSSVFVSAEQTDDASVLCAFIASVEGQVGVRGRELQQFSAVED